MRESNVIKLNIIYEDKDIPGLRTEVLSRIGTRINYEDDIWICDKKKKNPSSRKSDYSLYFKNYPYQYKILAKDYAIMKLSLNESVINVEGVIKRVITFIKYIDDVGVELAHINIEVVNDFKKRLKAMENKEYTKHMIWMSLKKFFDTISKLECSPKQNYFKGKNPFKRIIRTHEEKYIPEYVIKQLDNAFRDETIPLYLRLAYWICRSIPNRIGEALGMKINCLKATKKDHGSYVLFLPTYKQNGGYKEAQIRRIYLKYEGHGKYLIDMIKEQQMIAESLQDKIKKEDERSLLFTRNVEKTSKYGNKYMNSIPIITKYGPISEGIQKIIMENNIKDKDGKLYKITSHQLRHNGITDRLYSGFTLIQTILMTGHKGTAMPEKAYFHSNKAVMKNVQKKHIEKKDEPKVLYRGRILNMDEATEKRLLSNIRSRRIKNLGICSDFCDCKSFECLDCNSFIPDADDLPYYEEQVRIFEEKLIKVGEQKYLKENILYNLNLYKSAINKIHIAMQEGDNIGGKNK
jgi:integrase